MTNSTELRERFAAARAQGKRHKDAAAACGVSEGEAVAAHAGEHDGTLQAAPLRGPWIELLKSLEACGPLLALTRNEGVVHEKTGVYRNLSATGPIGLALGEEIDLRLFFAQWHAGFAVTEAAANRSNPPSMSLQFFDAHGTAVHKIFAREGSDRVALASIATVFAADAATAVFRRAEAPAAQKPDSSFDCRALGKAWSEMTDTHQFFGLLKQFGVERQQSFRLMEGRYAWRVAPQALRDLLYAASFGGAPIMVFVGSPGCIQIHTGPVTRIEPLEVHGMKWLNVLDEGFNLHLREDLVAGTWIVEKPTSDGVVTSVEAFDGEGGLMAMFFGARKPGVPEREDWRTLVRGLPRLAKAEA
ncbi:hemin-degrading factor [Ramlibacter sp.]|uniref:hemin-degrading factor n=1 Tax=Ramlibacter sp. TaxID=1917967 RepID=UPI003D10B86E